MQTVEETMETTTDGLTAKGNGLTDFRRKLAACLLVTVLGTGCMASNYDFGGISKLSGRSRVERLAGELQRESQSREERDLYDIQVIPLAHTSLNVFSESTDEKFPEGFVEADVDAYLPLFGVVDAEVSRYASDRELIERHKFKSYLWGLVQAYREQVNTSLGLRERTVRRFLWLFRWHSSPKYTEVAKQPPTSGLSARVQAGRSSDATGRLGAPSTDARCQEAGPVLSR